MYLVPVGFSSVKGVMIVEIECSGKKVAGVSMSSAESCSLSFLS